MHTAEQIEKENQQSPIHREKAVEAVCVCVCVCDLLLSHAVAGFMQRRCPSVCLSVCSSVAMAAEWTQCRGVAADAAATNTVPTGLESQVESGKARELKRGQGKSTSFVGCQGKMACIIRLFNCCCNIALSRKCGEFSYSILIGFLLFILLFLNSKCWCTVYLDGAD